MRDFALALLLILFQKSRDASSAAELNELRSADRHLREADQKRESEVTH